MTKANNQLVARRQSLAISRKLSQTARSKDNANIVHRFERDVMPFLTDYRRNLFGTCLVFCLTANANWTRAETQQKQKIVGLGATSCNGFMADATRKSSIQRDYLAWAQGYMSAILLTRPGTIDNGLDLAPSTFPLLKQLEFLRNFCAKHPDQTFPDAVDNLYKRLRQEIAS